MIDFQQPSQSDSELLAAIREILPTGMISDHRRLDGSLRKLEAKFGNIVFSTFLRMVFHVALSPTEARDHWVKLLRHHEDFRKQTGAEIDFRVSALDYFSRIAGILINPTIVESEEFASIYRDTVTDAMTGLFNFRYFEDSFARELSRADRYQSPLSLLFFDVDHFKQINDRLGHLVGDKVLTEVAQVIARSVRNSDYPCRYGGEEFAVIAPETSRLGALFVAARIRTGVMAIEVPELKETGMDLTISGGVVSFPEDGNKMRDLIDRADQALYHAKESGRNRVETFSADRPRRSRKVAA